jgi:hypothetical protein
VALISFLEILLFLLKAKKDEIFKILWDICTNQDEVAVADFQGRYKIMGVGFISGALDTVDFKNF